MIMTFDHLRYFLAIVEYKSFSLAAENLFISQSSLSKQIKSLEIELKKQLFIRSGAQIELTASGKLFFEFAKKVSKEYYDFLEYLPKNNGRKVHILRLGVLPLLLEYNFLDIISRFQVRHDHIQFVLSEDNQLKLIQMLDNHQLDAVIARSDFAPMHKYEFITINRDVLCAVFSRKHRLAGAESLSLNEIKNEQLAMIEEKSGIYQLLLNACIEEGFTPSIVFTSNRHGHLLGVLKGNSSVLSVLPSKLVNLELNPDLLSIPLKKKIYTTISLIRRKEMNLYLDEFFAWWNDKIEIIQSEQ